MSVPNLGFSSLTYLLFIPYWPLAELHLTALRYKCINILSGNEFVTNFLPVKFLVSFILSISRSSAEVAVLPPTCNCWSFSLLVSFVAYASMWSIYRECLTIYFYFALSLPSLLVSWCNSTFWCNSIGQKGKTPSRLGRSHLCNRIFLPIRDNSPNAQVCPLHGRSSRLSFDYFIDFLALLAPFCISVVQRHFHSGHYSAQVHYSTQVFLTKDFLLVEY